MQQSYAKLCGVTATVEVVDLVEDSLRLNAGAFARHGVTLCREFSPVPPITVHKHKVLQILVNLVRNAKYACDESGKTEKLIILRIAPAAEGVRISVIDNGVGIPEENMDRLFNHGFTTRQSGHGFGLHSGALAAQGPCSRRATDRDGAVARLGHSDKLLVLRKPAEPIEVLQCATALSRKWENERLVKAHVGRLEEVITVRTHGLEAANRQLRHLATHDPLTGLPNRVLLDDRLAQAMALADRDERSFALMVCKLDRFKLINDSLGHRAGDELQRLIRDARSHDFLTEEDAIRTHSKLSAYKRN